MNIANGTILFRRVNSVSFLVDALFLSTASEGCVWRKPLKCWAKLKFQMTWNVLRNIEVVIKSKLQFARHKMWAFVSLSRLKQMLSAALRISNLIWCRQESKCHLIPADPFRKLHGILLQFFYEHCSSSACVWCNQCSGIFNFVVEMEGEPVKIGIRLSISFDCI